MKKISIIIPCYNCENTIKKTVESIQENAYAENIEIILVNDGSSDNSIEVLNNLSQKYKNIKVINQKNKGISETRNVGIKNSTGSYVTFVDSDDYIINNCYKKIADILEKDDYDIIYYNFMEETNCERIKSKYKLNDEILNNSQFMEKFLLDKVSIATWDKIYNKQLIEKFKFNKEITIGEDALYVISVINNSQKIKVLNEYFYVYVQNEKSIVHKLNENIIQLAEIGKYVEEKIKIEYSDLYNYFNANMMLKTIHHISNNYCKSNNKEAYSLFKKIYDKNKIKTLLESKETAKSIKIELYILKFFGIKIYLRIFKYFKIMKRKIRKGD